MDENKNRPEDVAQSMANLADVICDLPASLNNLCARAIKISERLARLDSRRKLSGVNLCNKGG